ncbi:VOC family protein, partial [Agrobacterium cavarae]
MAKLIHSMVRVLDETRSVNFYKQAFNLDVAERFEFETFTLIYLSNSQGDFELELTVNKGREVPYALGDGYGHLAVSVEDVDAEHARLSELGLSVG